MRPAHAQEILVMLMDPCLGLPQVENEKRVWQALGYPAQHGLVQLRTQGEVASVEGHKADPLAGSAVVVTAPLGTPLASI